MVFEEIHEICFFSNGAYSFNEIYNIPIYIRKFLRNELKEWYEKNRQKESNVIDTNTGADEIKNISSVYKNKLADTPFAYQVKKPQ